LVRITRGVTTGFSGAGERLGQEEDAMDPKARRDATDILSEFGQADASVVAAKLLPLVYKELRALAAKYLRQERHGHTLDPTALVHEAFLRRVDQHRVDWQRKSHFLAVCAELSPDDQP